VRFTFYINEKSDVIPREGVESVENNLMQLELEEKVIPREGVESMGARGGVDIPRDDIR